MPPPDLCLLGQTNHCYCECDVAHVSHIISVYRGEISSLSLELWQLQYRSCAVCDFALDSFAFNINLKQFISFDVSSEIVKIDKKIYLKDDRTPHFK